jgi:glycosyltransferase involved in cell wall biosynthesis
MNSEILDISETRIVVKNRELSIIIPCYNEDKRLQINIFKQFAKENPQYHVLFVNDGSNDNTLQILQNAAGSNISVLDLKINGGKAEAVRQGMLYALKEIPSKYLAFWDADLATPLKEVNNLIEIAEKNNFDIVTGLRLMRLGANVKRSTKRHLFGRVFATVVSQIILKIPVYDTQCGAKVFHSKLIPVLFDKKFISRWFFDVEIFARYINIFGAVAATQKIYEYPLHTWKEVGSTRLKFKDFISVPKELFKIKLKYENTINTVQGLC